MTDNQTKKHILAMNDSEDVLELFRDLLEGEGYQVSTRMYASKTTKEIKEIAPDIVTLDYMWSSDDLGWSLLRTLKMDPETKNLPVIVCTGAVNQVQDLERHLQTMGVRVVIKPFHIEVLIREIKGALEEASASGT